MVAGGRRQAAKKGLTTSCQGAWQSCNSQKRVREEGAGGSWADPLVAMASITLTDNQLSHVWQTRDVALCASPAGCNYLPDIFQIIWKYAKIAAHAHFGQVREMERGRRRGVEGIGSTRAIQARVVRTLPKGRRLESTQLDSTRLASSCKLHVLLRIVALAHCIVLRCAFVLPLLLQFVIR